MGKTWKRQADILAFSVVAVTGELSLSTLWVVVSESPIKNKSTKQTTLPSPAQGRRGKKITHEKKQKQKSWKNIPPKSHTLEFAGGSLYFIWGRLPALCVADRLPQVWGSALPKAAPLPCVTDLVRFSLLNQWLLLSVKTFCVWNSFVTGRGVRGRKAQPGAAGDSAGTFWKRGGASRRLQMQSSSAGAAGKFWHGLPTTDWSPGQKMLQGSYFCSMCFSVLRTILLVRYSCITLRGG